MSRAAAGAAAAVAAVAIAVGLMAAANRPAASLGPGRTAEPLAGLPAGSERAVAACRQALGEQADEEIDRPAVLRVVPSESTPGSWEVSGDTGVPDKFYGGTFHPWNCLATADGQVTGLVFPS